MTSAKYPRSFHLPWSPGGTRDDKRLADVSALTGVEIVVTEKIDGSNLTYTRESVFARTHSAPPNHHSFNLAKATHARIRAAVPEGLSVFCEYCFAVHSIEYGALPDYSIVIGVRDDDADLWLNWTAVEQTAAALGLPAAPVLFRGVVESATTLERLTIQLASGSSVFGGAREGLVARAAAEFHSAAFHRMVGKYVAYRPCANGRALDRSDDPPATSRAGPSLGFLLLCRRALFLDCFLRGFLHGFFDGFFDG